MKDHLSPHARTIAINSLVLSSINYDMKIWGSTNATQLLRVQKVQNFAAKVALRGGAKRGHVTPFLRKLGLLRIEFKYKYGSIPRNILSIPTVRDMRLLPTRQQNQLYLPHPNTSTGAGSALVAAPRLWISLPACVRNAATIFIF